MASKTALRGGLAPKHLRAIARLRDSVPPDDAYNGYCWDVSELVASYLQKQDLDAELCESAGAVRDRGHVYVLLGDGTIIDPTLDQFYPGGRGNERGDWNSPVWAERDREEHGIEGLPGDNPWFGQVAVIAPDHPFAQHYWSHRNPAWAAGEVSHEYWREYREGKPAWYLALHGLASPSLIGE
jgi:hypothetical protein